MRILWVENHALFVRAAGRQFLGTHDLTVVPSIAAANARLDGQVFDAVLVDYDLDDGKGVELVEVIRRLPVRPWVIAASAHDAGNEALLAAGADATCSKMRFADIGRVLESVTGSTGAAPTVPQRPSGG